MGSAWRRCSRGELLAVFAASLVLTGATSASAHSNGTVFSGPVDADGAAPFWNPAAMAGATTSRVDIVANIGLPQGSYQRYGIDAAQTNRPFPEVSLIGVRPEPTLGIIIDRLWHKRLRLGFNITVPSAAGALWPEYVNDNGQQILGPTRYHVTSATVFNASASLGASIAVHHTFALGLSLNVYLSSLDVSKHVDLANQGTITSILPCASNPFGCESPAFSTPLSLKGSGISAGATMGFLWQPIPRVRIGASYMTPAKVPAHVDVTIDAKKLADFARQFLPSYGTVSLNGSGSVNITVPMRFNMAIAVDVHPNVEFMAQVRFINQSAAEIISGVVTERSSTLLPGALSIPAIHNDEWTAILRIVGRIKDRARLGFSLEYITASVPESFMTPSNLDFNVLSFNLGAQVRVWRQLSLGASFSQSVVFARDITKSSFANENIEPYNLPDPSGRYSGNNERVGLDVSAAF